MIKDVKKQVAIKNPNKAMVTGNLEINQIERYKQAIKDKIFYSSSFAEFMREALHYFLEKLLQNPEKFYDEYKKWEHKGFLQRKTKYFNIDSKQDKQIRCLTIEKEIANFFIEFEKKKFDLNFSIILRMACEDHLDRKIKDKHNMQLFLLSPILEKSYRK